MSGSSSVAISRSACWIFAILMLSMMVGCGRKGPPLPPQIRVADTTRDLDVFQESREAVLTWSYPDITTAGGPLPDLESVEVWRATIPAGREPPDVTQRDRELRYRLLEAEGELLATLDDAGLDDATRGSKLRFRDDLDLWQEAYGGEERWVVWYAVRSVCCRKRESEFSNIARLVPQLPPEAPARLVVSPEATGIVIAWSPEEGLKTIVERAHADDDWRVVTREPVTDQQWRDEGVEQGERWRYRLRFVRTVDGVQVIGEPSDPVELEYPDIYPPEVPSNLVCLPEEERVRVRWQSATDAAWYAVSRRVDEGDWELLVEHHRLVTFEDPDPPLGTLVYAVRAVDAAGNEAEPVTCTTLMGAQP